MKCQFLKIYIYIWCILIHLCYFLLIMFYLVYFRLFIQFMKFVAVSMTFDFIKNIALFSINCLFIYVFIQIQGASQGRKKIKYWIISEQKKIFISKFQNLHIRIKQIKRRCSQNVCYLKRQRKEVSFARLDL